MNEASIASLHGTETVELGPKSAKPTAISEGLTESSLSVWTDGRIDTGLWECTEGDFTAERDGYTEICTILSGRVTVETEADNSREFGPGDIMIMPSGWKGTWRVHEPLRKHYTTIKD